jgi:Cof subfamily protein (haloacid dehalogenase superfamily)
MNIKLIVTDLDQTLLRSDKTISNYSVEVLRRCQEKGIKIMFATARPWLKLTDFIAQISVDALCYSIGTSVMAEGKIIARFTFAPAEQNSIFARLKSDPNIYRISASSDDVSYFFGQAIDSQGILCDFSADCDVKFNLIAFRSKDIERSIDNLREYAGVKFFRVTDTNLVDIAPARAGKWTAIQLVAQHFRLNTAEIAAFGDDHNDLDMLQNCGVGVAMASAIPEAKSAARFICENNDSDGVAKWIEEHLLCQM